MKNRTAIVGIMRATAIAAALGSASLASAQSSYGPGQSWSSTWGPSATNRSLRLQEAQAIRTAEQGSGPTTIVNTSTIYDNRSNYQDLSGVLGTLGAIDFHIGDEIGQNTNSVGATNTGSTTIEITGNGNLVDATNSADSEGCIDSSVVNETLSLLDSVAGGDTTVSTLAPSSLPPCN